MSRIEKALEKAVRMRDSRGGELPREGGGPLPPAQPREEPGVPDNGAGACGVKTFDLSGVDPRVVCLTEPCSAAAEQYRRLRVRLFNLTKEHFRNTVMVTSAGMGEGKTLTAVNLAVSLAADINHRVLVVDADLRNSSVLKCLGLKAELGLSDCLSGRATLSEALIEPGIDGLTILPGGSPVPNPTELLASERMRALVRELKHADRDRYVIFDTSPVLVTAEPLSLITHMDGVLFIVQAEHTLPKAAEKALGLLKGSNVLGVVFNSVPPHLAKHGYPYYYHQYRGKGYGAQPGNGGA